MACASSLSRRGRRSAAPCLARSKELAARLDAAWATYGFPRRSAVRHLRSDPTISLFLYSIQHTLYNKSTKKYLLKSKGKTLDDVSSKMKLIENSFGDSGSKTESKDINEVIYELEGEIKTKENHIAE